MRPQPNFFQFERTPFQYALLVTSVLFAKFLHLYNHLTSLPPLLFILYLPTFLALDVLSATLFWILVHLQAHGRLSALLGFARVVTCLLLLVASSSQNAFFLETGGELKWGAAGNFAHDPAGMKLLLSGSMHIFLVSFFIVLTARIISQPLYHRTKALSLAVLQRLRVSHVQFSEASTTPAYRDASPHVEVSVEEGRYQPQLDGCEEPLATTIPVDNDQIGWRTRWFGRATVAAPFFTVIVLLIVRPKEFPYAHMSGSLPYTLLEMWSPESPDMCRAGFAHGYVPFPMPELLSSELWEAPHDKFVGWMPTASNLSSDKPEAQHMPHPTWLPLDWIPGFDRWYDESAIKDADKQMPPWERHGRPHRKHKEGINYDPAKDPMRITNLDQDILGPITQALKKQKVAIKHVVLLSLESTRKDVFPFKKDSHLHDLVKQSHSSDSAAAEANSILAELTMNAEILTGEPSGFDLKDHNESDARPGTWRNLGPEKGGINVVGALTGSSSTLKSILGSHCGVQPLPVDFTVEAQAHIYQPCLPSVLKLFNHNKASQPSESKEPDVNSMPWKSVFVQAITDQFDHEDKLNRHIGFSEVVVKDTLLDPSSKHFPPTEKESNYFGFPETQVKPYLWDLIHEAEEKNQRLFLSHLTSSTHHPWNTPESGGETLDYFARSRWQPERQLNRYLNTVKYGDKWIGEVMDMLEEAGVAEQTLVVLVGDHGMAFKEDSSHYTTFENGHISNLRVPLVFHHPSLPRIQLSVNATSMSIIPTILDLLVATSSLNAEDLDIASNLIQQYEGQSLIRPYQVEKNGRQVWNIGILNAGGALLSVGSAAHPFRLVVPVCKAGVYRFTSTALDPNELHPLEEYSISELAARVGRDFDDEAAQWVLDAEKIGKWWVVEQRRRWRYHGASLQDDRSPEEMKEAGKKKLQHWWDT